MNIPHEHIEFVSKKVRGYRDRFTVKRMLINWITFFPVYDLSVNNFTHMYLSDLRVYFKVQVCFKKTWSRMEEY